MKIKKRLLALIMTLVMAIAYMPAAAYAEADAEDSAGSDSPIKEIYFSGSLEGKYGTNEITNFYTQNFGVVVSYKDGTEVLFEYLTGTYKDARGEEHEISGFFRDKDGDWNGDISPNEEDYLYAEMVYDEAYENMVFKHGYNTGLKMMANVPYVVTDEKTGKEVVRSQNMTADVAVWCGYEKPLSVKFEPAEGTQLEGYIGYNYIDETFFYGEGNKFTLEMESLSATGEDETTTMVTYWDYLYGRKDEAGDVTEGFYDHGIVDDPTYDRLYFDEDFFSEVYLKKGVNKVKLPFYAYSTDSDEPIKLILNVEIVAKKYNAYANWPTVEYTGKNISKSAVAKKLVVRDSDDNVIPAKEYTFKWSKKKKIGFYEVKISFKDKTRYVDSITTEVYIGPKTPVVTKAAGGKKNLTVTWKKFTTAQMKNIDGMFIEVARNKNFTKGYKIIELSKKTLKKSNKKTIKKLTGGKKYYVRLSTYKTIKKDGYKYSITSNDSKAKTCRTKK